MILTSYWALRRDAANEKIASAVRAENGRVKSANDWIELDESHPINQVVDPCLDLVRLNREKMNRAVLESVLDNVLDNAVEYALGPGRVVCSVVKGEEAGRVRGAREGQLTGRTEPWFFLTPADVGPSFCSANLRELS